MSPRLMPLPAPRSTETSAHHLVGYGIKSRSSDPGTGDPAKDAGLPRRPSHLLPVFRCLPDLDSRVFVPRAAWPTLSAPRTFCQPRAPASGHVPGFRLCPASFPPPAQGEVAPSQPPLLLAREGFPGLLGKSAMCLRPAIQGGNQNSKIALIYRARHRPGVSCTFLYCLAFCLCKPRRQLPDGFHPAGEEV